MIQLAPIERMVLTIAHSRLNRGEGIDPNMATVLVEALERIRDELDADQADDRDQIDRP